MLGVIFPSDVDATVAWSCATRIDMTHDVFREVAPQEVHDVRRWRDTDHADRLWRPGLRSFDRSRAAEKDCGGFLGISPSKSICGKSMAS